jgi:hypothetical protein
VARLLLAPSRHRNATKHDDPQSDGSQGPLPHSSANTTLIHYIEEVQEVTANGVAQVQQRVADHPRRTCRTALARPHALQEIAISPFALLLTEGSACTLYSVTEDIKHMSKPSDLVQGTLDMLLLKILALEPMNGFAVSQRLKQVSGDVLQISDGSLYPALHKLEQEGGITAEWKTSVKRSPRQILFADEVRAATT